jgi:hypothetical protein
MLAVMAALAPGRWQASDRSAWTTKLSIRKRFDDCPVRTS